MCGLSLSTERNTSHVRNSHYYIHLPLVHQLNYSISKSKFRLILLQQNYFFDISLHFCSFATLIKFDHEFAGMEEEQGGIKKLFTLFLLIPHLGVLADKQCEAGEFLTPEKTLNNHNFRSVPVGGPLDCHLLCKKDPKCQSYNFVVFGNICELNNSTKEASPRDLVRDDARFYMGMKHAEGKFSIHVMVFCARNNGINNL